jgi:hypothetical protein
VQPFRKFPALLKNPKVHHVELLWFLISWGGVSPVGISATNGFIIPAPGEYGAFGGMRIGRGNRSIQIKPAPVPLYHKSLMT